MRNKGFTLLELTVVMVLLVVMLVVAMPRMSSQTKTAREEAQRVASDIRAIRHMAGTQNTRYRINFSATQYSTTTQDGSTAVLLPNSGGANVVTLDSGMSLSTTNIPSGFLVFDSLGRPYTDAVTPGTLLAADALVTITYGSDVATITIHKQTGVVE